MTRPFDAVLMVSFGGPEGPDDVRPFLANVLRGRRVPAERVEAVAGHYDLFGGVSPLAAITRRQVEGLRERLQRRGIDIPVFLGMRNWHPFIADTVADMAARGVSRAIGVIAAAHRSYSSCTQYRQNVTDALNARAARGEAPLSVTYVNDWHTRQGFVVANMRHVADALATLPAALRAHARVVFTAHSIPASMTGAARYQAQLMESASMVAGRLRTRDWALVYQSRSGRPDDPWLGPDIVEYLRTEHARGLQAVVVCPLGFLCDHIEVLYDLDHEAAAACREWGLPMARASAVNDAPEFLDALADAVEDTWRTYQRGRPLSLVSSRPPERVEGPPVATGRPIHPRDPT